MRRRRRVVDPLTAARVRFQSRCPDCRSTVAITRAGDQVIVTHDDSCRTLAELDAVDLTDKPVTLTRPPGLLDAQWDSMIATAVRHDRSITEDTGKT